MHMGKVPNHLKKKIYPNLCLLIFKSMSILWENSVHMFLSLLYTEMLPREYLTSKNLSTFPHVPLRLLHYPISPNTSETGIHIPAKGNLGGPLTLCPEKPERL